MKKIIAVIIFLTLLFAFSFVLQSKLSGTITKSVNGHSVETLFLKQITVLNGSFLFMDLLTGSIIVCSTVVFLILIFVLLNRGRMERRAKIKEDLLLLYQRLIFDALGDRVIDDRELKRFKGIIKNHFKRQIFIRQLIDVGMMIPKANQEKLKMLYYKLDLLKDLERKLRSRHWHKIIKGLKELTFLDICVYNDIVMKHIESKNDVLRMEAQIAMVKLSDHVNPFLFLANLKHNFSLWEQITLHQLMVQNDMKVPDFGEWVLSENPTVAMFCLRMIREYNQTQNAEKISRLMYYDNNDVRRLAIQVAGDLKLDSLSTVLKKQFKDETYENSLEIIIALGKISDPSTIGFLQKVVDSEEDTQLQIEGVKAISNMGDVGRASLEKMLHSDYKNYNIVIKHVLDNRIN